MWVCGNRGHIGDNTVLWEKPTSPQQVFNRHETYVLLKRGEFVPLRTLPLPGSSSDQSLKSDGRCPDEPICGEHYASTPSTVSHITKI